MSKKEDRVARGKRLEEYWLSKGLKPSKLAKNIHVSPGIISEMAAGKKDPGIKTIEAFIRYSDINVYWWLSGEGSMYREISEVDPITEKINIMLQDMDEELRRGILKHIEKEKLLMELMKQQSNSKSKKEG